MITHPCLCLRSDARDDRRRQNTHTKAVLTMGAKSNHWQLRARAALS
jgi:hypothetical protein